MEKEKLKFALKVAIESLIWIAENNDVSGKIMSQRAKATVVEVDRIINED